MKTKWLVFLLSGLALIGCKNPKAGEPTSPEQKAESLQTDTISKDLLLSYFPYKNGDRIVYYNDLMGDCNYTVVESVLMNENDTTISKTTLFGYDYKAELLYVILLDAKLVNKHVLTINFQQSLNVSTPENVQTANKNEEKYTTHGSYTYDAFSGADLPQSITLSNGSIIKQNEGLVYFIDYDSEKWYYYKRI